jgi:hypothetical protein
MAGITNWRNPTPEDLDNWPLRADEVWEDALPSVVCDAWVMYASPGVQPAPRMCHSEISGSSLRTIREALIQHVHNIEHVESPFLDLLLRTGEITRKAGHRKLRREQA